MWISSGGSPLSPSAASIWSRLMPRVYQPFTTVPDTLSLHSAKLTGATGATTVDFAQDIPGHLSAALATNITVSFSLLNNTGANLTPLVRIDTADSFNGFGSVTNRFSQAVDEAVTTGNWKRWTMTIDASAFTNISNGLRFIIRLPSGALNSGALGNA